MDELDRQANRLAQRAAELEDQLAKVILELDDDAILRLAQGALDAGFTQEEVAAVFRRSATRHLETAYDVFAIETAEDFGLPLAPAAAAAEAEIAIGKLITNLAEEGQQVVERLTSDARRLGWSVPQLGRAIRDQIGLTEAQNGYVATFEMKLRTDHRRVLRENKLRDRRFDRRLMRDQPLTESEVAKMVTRYAERWSVSRSAGVARMELLRASNGAALAAWLNAENKGLLATGVRKYWVHMHDSHVRESHLEIPILNPRGIRLADSFVTPLGRLRYPLDPLGEAADVIGCRCALAFDTANPTGAS